MRYRTIYPCGKALVKTREETLRSEKWRDVVMASAWPYALIGQAVTESGVR